MQEESAKANAWVTLPEWALLPDIGLYMDQVITLMERTFKGALPGGEMTRSMVNNYVKFGLIPRPAGKKYEREHLARLMMICVLKQALSMEEIAALLCILCREGAQTGYERFIAEVEAISGRLAGGGAQLPGEARTQEAQALRAGVTAALCTIRARQMLCLMKLGKN